MVALGGRPMRVRVLVLPHVIALGDAEAAAIHGFAASGGEYDDRILPDARRDRWRTVLHVGDPIRLAAERADAQ